MATAAELMGIGTASQNINGVVNTKKQTGAQTTGQILGVVPANQGVLTSSNTDLGMLLPSSNTSPSVKSAQTTAPVQTAEQIAAAKARSDYLGALPSALSNIDTSANEAIASNSRSLQSAAEAAQSELKTGRTAITTARETTEMNRLNAVRDILDYVRGNIQSANLKYSNSSGAEALSRLYGIAGDKQVRGASNEAAIGQRGIDTQEAQWGDSLTQAVTNLNRQRTEYEETIASNARKELAALEEQGRNAGVTGQVNVDAQRNAILQRAQQQLAAVTNWFNTQTQTLGAVDMDTIRRNAAGLVDMGTVGVPSVPTTLPSGR